MNLWKYSTFALAVALGTVVATGYTNTASADQPMMEKALGNLKEAIVNMQNATDDKGGHKAKAIDFTKKAIEQVEKGMAFDSKHDSGKNENKK
jgi:hypothetical protein